MAFTYDLSTNLGKTRLLIPDSNPVNPVFSDAEINAVLSLVGSDVRLAAAECLRIAASDMARVLRVTKELDIDVDAVRPAEFLLKRADRLEQSAIDQGGLSPGYVEWGVSAEAEAEIVAKTAQRQGF